jgi:hypothetical protein
MKKLEFRTILPDTLANDVSDFHTNLVESSRIPHPLAAEAL